MALNKSGEELWKQYVGSGFESEVLKTSLSSLAKVADVDGDGSNEIILMPPHAESATGQSLYKSMTCYNADGNERWRFEFHPKMVFGKEVFSEDYDLEVPLLLGDFDRDGQHEIVFAAHHSTWWPSVVGRLNASSGTLMSEYWHPGWIKIAPLDIDGNGLEEILVAGYNNSFERSALAVLDPRRMEGQAPASGGFQAQGVQGSPETYYVLLPDPDLYKLANPWTQGSGVSCTAGGIIEVRSGRILPAGKPGEWIGVVLFFYFDNQLNCVNARAGDDFSNYHVRMERAGTLTATLDESYFVQLRQGVQYWDGEKFVKEPTMNQRYEQVSAGER
jgi:hypothetical protein